MALSRKRLYLHRFLLLPLTLGLGVSALRAQQVVEQNKKPRVTRNDDSEDNAGGSSGSTNQDQTSPPSSGTVPISFIGPPGSDYVFTNPPSEDYRFLDPDEGCADDGTPRNCRDTQKDCCRNPKDPTQYICCIPPSGNTGQGAGGSRANNSGGSNQSGQSRGESSRGQGNSLTSLSGSTNSGSIGRAGEDTIAIAPAKERNNAG